MIPLKLFVNNTVQSSKKYSFRNITIYSTAYFIVMLGYAITVNLQEESERKGMGWLNVLLVFVTDGVILSKSVLSLKFIFRCPRLCKRNHLPSNKSNNTYDSIQSMCVIRTPLLDFDALTRTFYRLNDTHTQMGMDLHQST